MATKVYGYSDDLIEFDGDLNGEINCYSNEADDNLGTLIAFDDGTVIIAKFGKSSLGIWSLRVLRKGTQLASVEVCEKEDADPHSDIILFRDGPLRAWYGVEAYRVD